jgi:hypothetical protein
MLQLSHIMVTITAWVMAWVSSTTATSSKGGGQDPQTSNIANRLQGSARVLHVPYMSQAVWAQ